MGISKWGLRLKTIMAIFKGLSQAGGTSLFSQVGGGSYLDNRCSEKEVCFNSRILWFQTEIGSIPFSFSRGLLYITLHHYITLPHYITSLHHYITTLHHYITSLHYITTLHHIITWQCLQSTVYCFNQSQHFHINFRKQITQRNELIPS